MGGYSNSPPLIMPFTMSGLSAPMGQGNKPELWAVLSTSDISDPTPAYTDVTADVRGFSSSRGRDSEQAEMEAGTATVVLDNRDRTYDPSIHPEIRPGNRVRLYERFSGITNPIFSGYAEAFQQSWPGGGWSDALCTVAAVDEFKRLNLVRMPAMDPPVATYADLVAYELPDGYWRCDDRSSLPGQVKAERGGRDLVTDSSDIAFFGTQVVSPIAGDRGSAISLINGGRLATDVLEPGSAGSAANCNEMTWGMWFQFNAFAVSTKNLVVGPHDGSSNAAFSIQLNSSGQIVFNTRNSAGSTVTSTSSALSTDTWYFVVCTITGGSQRIYIDGVQHDSDAFTAPFHADNSSSAQLFVGDLNATTQTFSFDEMWMKRLGVTADRVTALYEGGTARGFVQLQTGPSLTHRLNNILDAVSSDAPRSFRPATRVPLAQYMAGKTVLEEIRTTMAVENIDAVFFAAADGTLTFLGRDHRVDSPWDTVQLTFGDEGHADEWPYEDVITDFSDSTVYNEISVTSERAGFGTAKTASDQTSIDRYGPRALAISNISYLVDDNQDIADGLLAKYKDPMMRMLSIRLNCSDLDILFRIFDRELGDRVRLIRTLPPGGAWFDQEAFIQKIEVEGSNDQAPWIVTLGVSPL